MRPRFFLFSGLLFVSIVTIVQYSAASRDHATPSRLQLTVRTDKKVYSLHEKLHMETQVTNVSRDTVYLYQWDLCWGQGPALSLFVVDSSGSTVEPAFLLDCVPPPPKSGDMSQFVKLDPNMFFGTSDEFVLRDFVKKPGNYTFEIQLGSALTPEWLAGMGFPKLPYWTREDKPLERKLQITVKP
jgi:hypothetical protein